MIEDAEIKKGLVVYHYRDIDSCIEKGIISDAKSYDICRRDFYLRCVTQIDWVAYVDEAGNEVFVHFSGLNMEGFKTLSEGQTVEFDLTEGDKGAQATNVTVVQ